MYYPDNSLLVKMSLLFIKVVEMEIDFDSELVIGLVSAVGTETLLVTELLKERMNLAGYNVQQIKVSEAVIPQLVDPTDFGSCQYTRIVSLMDGGNKARKVSEENKILALGAASVIFAKRDKEGNDPKPAPKTAYIINSLKRPEEVACLRQIYPSGFVLIGIHADEKRRMEHLTTDRGMTQDHALELVKRDSDESEDEYGQRVNKTFHLADFFVRISSNRDQLRHDITRIVSLWFGDPYITPTFDEHAMFMAFAAALRSADMSRQVGAVVTKDSQILSTGANDCPKPQGGLYWPARDEKTRRICDTEKGRDYTRPDGDSNRAEQLSIIDKIIKRLQSATPGLDPELLKSLLDDSPLRDLTEYGRVVHAEMEALLCCSRNGLSTIGTTLYCTTFPCHNCAKHIIAAGVKRVVYVEPYPKSKALDFHDDAISPPGDAGINDADKVKFDAFVGIGPRRFFDLFSMNQGSSYDVERKHRDGKRLDWHIEKSRLRVQMKPTSYLDDEASACTLFSSIQTAKFGKQEVKS